MSNQRLWLRTIKDLAAIVDSAQYSIPLQDMFDDERLYEPMKENIPDVDLASWLMFDTEENRETTTMLIAQFWRHLQKSHPVEPFLERVFDSYLSIYRVNYADAQKIYIQNLIFREPASVIAVTEASQKLVEGDIFFGRILFTDAGNFAFRIARVVPEELREPFAEKTEQMLALQPLLTQDAAMYKQTLKDGNPEMLFLFSLAMDRARDEEFEDFDAFEEEFYPEEDDREGIYQLASEGAVDPEVAIGDMYVLERMENRLLLEEGKTFGDRSFSAYGELMDDSAATGEFSDDEQMLRILRLFRQWTLEEKNPAARRSLEGAEDDILTWKTKLERSVEGIYRNEYFDAVIADSVRERGRFIDAFDAYLEVLIERELATTETGALNRRSLGYVLPVLGIDPASVKPTLREGSFPELVLFRHFAILKDMIRIDESGHIADTLRMEQYLQFSEEEKLSLWLSTLFHPNLIERDPYFEEWKFEEAFRRFKHSPFEALLKAGESREAKMQKIILKAGRALKLYTFPKSSEDALEWSPLGRAVLEYMGIEKRENVVPLFDN